MKKKISLIMAVAMMLSTFATASVGAEETAASTGASIAFGDSARVVDSLEITASNIADLSAFNAKDADGNYLTDPVDLNGWTFQRTIPDGTNTMQAVSSSKTWKQKNWIIINKFGKISNNTAIPELNSPFSIEYNLGTDSNNAYVEFGNFDNGSYYRMNFRLPTTATTEDGKTYYNNVVRVERYDNGTVAFSKDVVVTRRTTKYSTFQFNGKITYDGENLLLTQENAVDVIVNEGWENWEMWPARVSGNVRVGTGNCKLYVNKLTVTSAAQNATVNDFILNRTFTGADTEAALEAEGWDIKMSSEEITADALAALEVGYDADIAGDYTVQINASKKQNNTDIYIRYDKSTKNGYMVRSRLASGKWFSVGKVENGTYVEKEKITFDYKIYDTSNTNYYVSVADIGDDVKVTLRVVRASVDNSVSWTDVKTDENEPIKSGGFLFKTKDAGKVYVSSVKAYPTATGSKEVSDVDVKYLMNNTEIETIEADGAVYMKMPTAILGQDFSIICALYEDGVMKGITQVAPIEAYNANGVKLFNTTGLSGKVSVKTFIWSGINQMQALTTSKGI